MRLLNLGLKQVYIIFIKELKLSSISLSGIYINVNVKSFDNPISECKIIQNIVNTEKTNTLSEIKKTIDIKLNEYKETLNNESSIQKKVLILFKNEIILSHKGDNSNSIIDQLSKIKDTEKINISGVLTMILNKLNTFNLPNLFIHLIEKENFTNVSKLIEGTTNTDLYEQLFNFYYDTGINTLSLFRKIKNNKLELSEITKDSFYNSINDKYSYFKIKLNSIKNINSNQYSYLPDKISFYMIENILNKNRKLHRKKEGITYKNDNLKIIYKIFNKTAEISTDRSSNLNVK